MLIVAAIICILSVVDTRDFDDSGKAVPGSGAPRRCDRCAATHVIYFSVKLADGGVAVVGSGCASAADMIPARVARSLAAAATREAKLLARHEALTNKIAEMSAIWKRVERMPHPPVMDGDPHLGRGTLVCGDARAVSLDASFDGRVRSWERAKLHQQVVHAWRTNRFEELGGVSIDNLTAEMEAVAKKVDRASANLDKAVSTAISKHDAGPALERA